MDFSNLKTLHLDMLEKEIASQLFRAKIGVTTFDVLFATGDGFRPFLALSPAGGTDPRVFRFEVQRGYRIDAFLGDAYADARDLYFGRGKSTRKLQAKDFFDALHAAIPTEASDAMVPSEMDADRLMGDGAP